MNQKLQTPEVDQLFDAILTLETREDCYKFFEDVCTIQEILYMGQRLEVAKLLRKNTVYQDISNQTGSSTATISRVNRALEYGADGYDLVFERLGLTGQDAESDDDKTE